jgi:hypothetical protein
MLIETTSFLDESCKVFNCDPKLFIDVMLFVINVSPNILDFFVKLAFAFDLRIGAFVAGSFDDLCWLDDTRFEIAIKRSSEL